MLCIYYAPTKNLCGNTLLFLSLKTKIQERENSPNSESVKDFLVVILHCILCYYKPMQVILLQRGVSNVANICISEHRSTNTISAL
jgi:hypothetical protein